jgi:DNA topoisomerase-1
MASSSEEEFMGDEEQTLVKKQSKRPKIEDDGNDDDDMPLTSLKKTKTRIDRVKPDPAPSSSSQKKEAVKKRKHKSLSQREDAKKTSVKKVKTEPNSSKPRELKKLDKTERLQYAMQSFLWWNAPELPEGCQWRTMEHSGVSFPETYEPHGVKMMYDGQPVELTPIQEEAATFFAAMDPEGMHLGNPKTGKIFIKNFFADFREILGKKHIVKEFKKCDFEPIRKHLNEQKIIRKAITDEERKANKEDRSQTLHQFGFSIVDGHIERVGNFNMEPPGAFRGRGEHPKMGKLKSRVLPEQVSLNLSECAPVPPCPVPGHAWSDVRHDPRGQWLATWKENINNQSKYMQLAAQSSFKGKSDRSKYSKAGLLCKNIEKIRKSYKKDLKSKDMEVKQLATATWVIDRLALRVGGEKDTDEEADTVGCCSLRVEHLHFDPNGEGGDSKEIELEFLGKDSMLFKQTIDFGATLYNDSNGLGAQVYDNLKSFCKKKKSSEEVFHVINPTMLNNHLKQFMDGLSAKVFRTYNASKTLQTELRKYEVSPAWRNLTASEKVVEYNNANREVAILCNHQRSVSKAQETQLENITAKVGMLKKQKKDLKKILKLLTAGEADKIPTKKSPQTMTDEVQKALEKAKKLKDTAKTNEEKIRATEADEKAKAKKRALADSKFQKAHLWEKVPTKEQVVKKIEAWNGKISKMEMDLKHKDDNKEVSLGTSKINYMDPRISVAWCKRNEVPIEKIFSKTLRDKFNWAMAVVPDWEFNEHIAKEA